MEQELLERHENQEQSAKIVKKIGKQQQTTKGGFNEVVRIENLL